MSVKRAACTLHDETRWNRGMKKILSALPVCSISLRSLARFVCACVLSHLPNVKEKEAANYIRPPRLAHAGFFNIQ